jgi:putative two-component system response regulator
MIMSKTILVVDDDDMNLKLAYFTLKRNVNYIVLLASSGMSALDMMQLNDVDLVLLDIEMPVLNGIKTFERMKNNEKFASIPVIFLTGNSNSKMVMDAAWLGASDYIIKPFEPEELLYRVKKTLGE